MRTEKTINPPIGKGYVPDNYWKSDNWKEIILPIRESNEIRLSVHLVRDVFLTQAKQGNIERKSKGVWVWKRLLPVPSIKAKIGDIYAMCLIDNKAMIIPEEWEETALKK